MNDEEWVRVLAAYRDGLNHDLIQTQDQVGGEWGVMWTVAPCSDDAMQRAARQVQRCRAVRVRHIRRARIRSHLSASVEAIVSTEFPPIKQQIRCLSSNRIIHVPNPLLDGLLVLQLVQFASLKGLEGIKRD